MQTCMHYRVMARTLRAREKVDLQVRGVPSTLRRRLGERAQRQGVSMSRLVISLLEDNIDRPATIDEWVAELAAERPRPRTAFTPSTTLREIRDEVNGT